MLASSRQTCPMPRPCLLGRNASAISATWKPMAEAVAAAAASSARKPSSCVRQCSLLGLGADHWTCRWASRTCPMSASRRPASLHFAGATTIEPPESKAEPAAPATLAELAAAEPLPYIAASIACNKRNSGSGIIGAAEDADAAAEPPLPPL